MATKHRKVRLDQFRKQLDEVGIGELQEVEIAKEVSVFIRLGVSVESNEETEEFAKRVDDAANSRDLAVVLLDYYPAEGNENDGTAGAAQLETLEEHGGTADVLAALWAASTQAAREELGKLRPRRS